MRQPISAWTATASTLRCVRTSPKLPIGIQGIGFDRLELDAWVDEYVARNGRPGRSKGVKSWDARRYQASSSEAASGTSTSSIGGRRICESTGAAQLEEAERYLARLMETTRQAQVYGVRPSRTFEQAAAKFVLENQHKRSLDDDILQLKLLMPWIGRAPIDCVHLGTLKPWIEHRRREGKAVGTINHGLKIVRRILNLAASEWVDEQGLTWLPAPPKIKLLPDQRQAATISDQLGGAVTPFRRASRLLGQHGFVRGQHGLPRPGDLLVEVGLGSCGPAIWDQRVHHPWVSWSRTATTGSSCSIGLPSRWWKDGGGPTPRTCSPTGASRSRA